MVSQLSVRAFTRSPLAHAGLLVACVAVTSGCEPDFSGRISEVRRPTVLAVRSEPAQAAPGAEVSYQVLVASPDGTIDSAQVSWSFCNIPKPVAEINDVTTECFAASKNVVDFGSGPTAMSVIPSGACREFGPDLPSTKPGQPPGRPADPDATGGFYQPVVLTSDYGDGTSLDLAQTRLVCSSPNGTVEQVKQLKESFIPNANPRLASVTLPERGDAELSAEGAQSPLEVQKGATLELRASWPACPEAPECGDDFLHARGNGRGNGQRVRGGLQ